MNAGEMQSGLLKWKSKCLEERWGDIYLWWVVGVVVEAEVEVRLRERRELDMDFFFFL